MNRQITPFPTSSHGLGQTTPVQSFCHAGLCRGHHFSMTSSSQASTITNISRESMSIEGLDLARQWTKKNTVAQSDFLQSLDLGCRALMDRVENPQIFSIHAPVLTPSPRREVASKELLTTHPFRRVTLASYYFSFLAPLLGYGPGRPDHFKHYRRGFKSLAITYSSIDQGPRNYIEGLQALSSLLLGSQSETREEIIEQYGKLKSIKKLFFDYLKSKLERDLNEEYLEEIYRMMGKDEAEVLLSYLDLDRECIDKTTHFFEGRIGSSSSSSSCSGPDLSWQEKINRLCANMSVPDSVLTTVTYNQKLSSLDTFKQGLDSTLPKKDRSAKISGFLKALPLMNTFQEAEQGIEKHQLNAFFLMHLKRNFKEHLEKYDSSTCLLMWKLLRDAYQKTLVFVLAPKYCRCAKDMKGVPTLPDEMALILSKCGYDLAEGEGYFYLSTPYVKSTLRSSSAELQESLLQIHATAQRTLHLVVREQKLHTFARFGDLLKSYKNFVARARLIANAFEEPHLDQWVKDKIVGYLQEGGTEGALRDYQGNDELLPQVVESIEKEMTRFLGRLGSEASSLSLASCSSSSSSDLPMSPFELPLSEIKRNLEEQENIFIREMAASILDLLNTHSLTLRSKDCFKQHIEHLICEIIQKISCSSHDCLTLSKNLDCILPEKSMHFIKHCVIRQLSVKQEVSSWDPTTPAKEYFDRDDRRALARLSLLGSAERMVDEIRLITNEKFVSRQVLNYLSKAHTLPYPQLFFARSISPQDCSIHSGIFQAYKGYADSALRVKSAEFNALFQRTIRPTQELDQSIEEAIRLSFEISQREFSEVYDLPRLINQDVDSLSEFLGYNEMLKGILIRCVEGVDHPTKISIFKELTPYITSVLKQISNAVNEMSSIPRAENANLLKLVMICNVTQSILAIKLKFNS